MAAKKSEHNSCPVCGKPRGKGPYEFAHGACAIQRAKTDGKKKVVVQFGDKSRELTEDQVKRSKARAVAKHYVSGKRLPDWMFS